MKRWTMLMIAAVLMSSMLACQQGGSSAPAGAGAAPAQTPLQRGEYLVAVLGCDDCHTPKVMGPEGPMPDMSRRLIGHPENETLTPPPVLPPGSWIATTNMGLTAWSGPWGLSYAINLTPDQDTGIGIWTEDMFIKTIRTGKHMSAGRPILPPMPWTDYNHLTDEDLKAVWAYLRTLPPTKNHVPEPVIAPPPPQQPPA